VLGETNLVGIDVAPRHTVKAATLCTMQLLKKRHFLDTVARFDEDKERLQNLLREAKTQGGHALKQKLQQHNPFKAAQPYFLDALCMHAQDKFYGPDEAIIKFGTPASWGKSPLYVLLAGRTFVQSEQGVTQNTLTPGEIFGEGGALGLSTHTLATIRAYEGLRTIHVVEFPGHHVKNAFTMFPEERAIFEEVREARADATTIFLGNRDFWVNDVAFPAMAACPLFEGQPAELIKKVAAMLTETSYKEGEVIAVCGCQADSMLVILEGAASAESSKGEKLGRLTVGGWFGEVAALGLFTTNLASLRAVGDTRVLRVREGAIMDVLGKFEGEMVEASKAKFEKRRKQRLNQVEKGTPLRPLNIGVQDDCIAARAIALQAMRLHLAPGELCFPLPENNPCGDAFWLLLKGQAVLEVETATLSDRTADGPMARQASAGGTVPGSRFGEAVPVMPLHAPHMLSEGLAESYKARFRAVTACDIYRVRVIDFETAVATVPSVQKWLPRFRMLAAERSKQLHHRAEASRGIVDGLLPHPNDPDIHEWRDRRLTVISRSKEKASLDWGSVDDLLPVLQTTTKSQVSSIMTSLLLTAPAFATKRSIACSTMSKSGSMPELRRGKDQKRQPAHGRTFPARSGGAPGELEPKLRGGHEPAGEQGERQATGTLMAAVRLPKLESTPETRPSVEKAFDPYL